MILDFSLYDTMNLSNIKRWGIIDMSREQSVAEHSYNVAMISSYLINHINTSTFDADLLKCQTVSWALVHDLPEILSGDIPTPMKSYLKDSISKMEEEKFPKWHQFKETIEGTLVQKIVKVADFVDAIQFAKRYCIDERKSEIIEEMVIKMESAIEDVRVIYDVDLSEAIV